MPSLRDLKIMTGAAGPKAAQQVGDAGGASTAGLSDMADEAYADRQKEIQDEQRRTQGMKKGGAVKGWGKARGARKAKVY